MLTRQARGEKQIVSPHAEGIHNRRMMTIANKHGSETVRRWAQENGYMEPTQMTGKISNAIKIAFGEAHRGG